MVDCSLIVCNALKNSLLVLTSKAWHDGVPTHLAEAVGIVPISSERPVCICPPSCD